MSKKLLVTLMASLLLTSASYAMMPSTSSGASEEMSESVGGVLEDLWGDEVDLQCPLCLEMRTFPSRAFLQNLMNNLTDKQRRELILTITDYTGEYIPGSFCQICGESLPK